MPALRAQWAVLMAIAVGSAAIAQDRQPPVEARSKNLIAKKGLRFRDLNGNGHLDAYEDWRLSPLKRAADLVKQMTLDEKAGMMVHPIAFAYGPFGAFTGYNLDYLHAVMERRHVHAFIGAVSKDPVSLAADHNRIQEFGEASRLGIPVYLSSDPRHAFVAAAGKSNSSVGMSQWPEFIGMGALGDASRTRQFGDAVRREYRAVGLNMILAPQADLATEPRWNRINGTFGSNPDRVSALSAAFVEGVQGSEKGLTKSGVAAVAKHWAGYGAEIDGIDAHAYAGRFALLPGKSLDRHLSAFTGVLNAGVAGMMPAYPILRGANLHGRPLEQVAPGFNRQLLTEELRTRLGYNGIILSDWQITDDCPASCRDPRPMGPPPPMSDGLPPPNFKSMGKPWGMEDASSFERFIKAIDAGVDQFGGTDDADLIVKAVHEHRVSESRIDASVRRIVVPMFEMGLFENPYVDEAAAGRIADSSELVAQGEAVQRDAQILLQNRDDLLPLKQGTRVYLHGIDPATARNIGLVVVDSPDKAEVAVVKVAMRRDGLSYDPTSPDMRYFITAAQKVPTVFVSYLDRPAILTEITPKAAAILVNFGASDQAIMDDVVGRSRPLGHLPYELPSSESSVIRQAPADIDDTGDPLFPAGFGLELPRR